MQVWWGDVDIITGGLGILSWRNLEELGDYCVPMTRLNDKHGIVLPCKLTSMMNTFKGIGYQCKPEPH